MTREIPLSKGKVAIVDDADFDWLSRWKWHYAGATGYAARRDWQGKRYVLMHRLIVGTPEGMDTDHINGDKLDNRRVNLRIATTAQNGHNRRGLPGKRSQFKGVSVFGGFHYVRIFAEGRNHYYGRFTDERTAARVYDYAARLHYGEFAYLNLPGEPLTAGEFTALTQRKQPTSQYRGVAWIAGKRRWQAQIQVDGKHIYLGRFANEIDAAYRYNEAATKYHGPKAVLNQLEERA